MKKVISAVVAGVMVAVLALSLAACNSDDTPAGGETGTSVPAGVTVESGTEA